MNQAHVAEKNWYYAPSYLCFGCVFGKWGKPNSLQDLQEHQLLYFGAAKRGRWPLISTATRKTYPIEFTPALNSQ